MADVTERYSQQFLVKLKEDVLHAWKPKKVHLGPPRTEQDELPYAVINIEEIGEEPSSIHRVEQTYVFGITYVDGWKFGTELERLKMEKASLLVSALLRSKHYGDDGYLPAVPNVSFAVPGSEADDPIYKVHVTFVVRRQAKAVLESP